MSLIIKFKLLYPDSKPPTRAKSGDAGWDLAYYRFSSSSDQRTQDAVVHYMHTGVAVEIPPAYFGLLRPRSSLSMSCYQFTSSGIIDSGYRGEIIVPLRACGNGRHYTTGDRIAQLIILPLPDVSFVQVNELSESERGMDGFGSTGK